MIEKFFGTGAACLIISTEKPCGVVFQEMVPSQAEPTADHAPHKLQEMELHFQETFAGPRHGSSNRGHYH